jgi:hypothetical protein
LIAARDLAAGANREAYHGLEWPAILAISAPRPYEELFQAAGGLKIGKSSPVQTIVSRIARAR